MLMNVQMLMVTTVTPMPCARTLKDLTSAAVFRDMREMDWTVSVGYNINITVLLNFRKKALNEDLLTEAKGVFYPATWKKKLERLNMPYFYLDLSCFFDVLIIRIHCLEKIKNILIWRKTKLVKSVDQSFIYPCTDWWAGKLDQNTYVSNEIFIYAILSRYNLEILPSVQALNQMNVIAHQIIYGNFFLFCPFT